MYAGVRVDPGGTKVMMSSSYLQKWCCGDPAGWRTVSSYGHNLPHDEQVKLIMIHANKCIGNRARSAENSALQGDFLGTRSQPQPCLTKFLTSSSLSVSTLLMVTVISLISNSAPVLRLEETISSAVGGGGGMSVSNSSSGSCRSSIAPRSSLLFAIVNLILFLLLCE